MAKSADHERAVVFFLFFARFEDALKRAGFVRRRRSKDAEADWTKYAGHCSAVLENNKEPRFQRAVEFLRKNPPKKQTVSGGQLDFIDDSFAGTWDMHRVLTLVCRVRNNLFHGGKKLLVRREEAVSRDIQLLNAGLAVMQACLDWDANLNSTFLEELDRS